ncbi:protein of unknown function [Ruminococcaceae bacterium BL-6]|nr:protein of unknown function [Ruminococcaceae bacterium BL-6]
MILSFFNAALSGVQKYAMFLRDMYGTALMAAYAAAYRKASGIKMRANPHFNMRIV